MARASMSTTRRPVVLLVQPSRDDSLDMYTEFLRYHGLAVIQVSDARHALMLVPQADIVVTGMNLDDPMDGVELVSRVRHDDRTRSTPIIVLTACAWPKDRERAEGAGCDVFLLKPCLPTDLLREVRQLLTPTLSLAADTGTSFSSLHSARCVVRTADLHDEGVIDEVAGKTQAAVGRTKPKVGDAIRNMSATSSRK